MTTRSKTGTRAASKPRTQKPAARRRAPARQNPPATLGAAHVHGFIVGVVAGAVMGAAGMLWLMRDNGPAKPVPARIDATAEEEAARPRFDFYTVLPEEELQLAKPQAQEAQQIREAQQYILQAGSFRRPEDADRRKGELAFLGLESEVQRSENEHGVWYRIYIGPFDSRSDMTRARSLAEQADIDTLLIKRARP